MVYLNLADLGRPEFDPACLEVCETETCGDSADLDPCFPNRRGLMMGGRGKMDEER